MKSTKHLLLLIIALISININAQETVSLTINVETAGTLPELIPTSQKNQITNLTLTGNLNGTDIRYIREMAGSDADTQFTYGSLSVLDLAKIKIVAGGDYYINLSGRKLYSGSNTFGEGIFYGCNTLTSVILPNNVTKIGDFAFGNCFGLTSVTIPNNPLAELIH